MLRRPAVVLIAVLLASPTWARQAQPDAPAAKAEPDKPKGDKAEPGADKPASDKPSPDKSGPDKPKKERKLSPRELVADTREFFTNAKCAECDGKGSVTKQELNPSRRGGGGGQPFAPERGTRNVTKPCKVCGTLGLASAQTTWSRAAKVAKTLDAIDLEHKELDAKLEGAQRNLEDAANLGVAKWGTRLNERLMSEITGNSDPVGKPIACTGTIIDDRLVNGVRSHRIDVAGRDVLVDIEQTLIVNAVEGESVLIGGVIARRQLSGNAIVLTLRRGYVVKGKTDDAREAK